MPKTKAPWSKTLLIDGYRVRLFERGDGGASIYYAYRSSDGKRVVKSTKRTNRKDAEAHVKGVFAIVLERMRTGQTETGKPVTLGQVFTA